MATYLSNELAGSATGLVTAAPVGYKPKATVQGARLKRLRATVTYASQAIADVIQLGSLPAGCVFAYGVLNADTSAGTATLSIGNAGTAAKYRAAATFTATDTPTFFGKAVPAAASDAGSAAEELVTMTIATAALPASGTMTVDLFYSAPN